MIEFQFVFQIKSFTILNKSQLQNIIFASIIANKTNKMHRSTSILPQQSPSQTTFPAIHQSSSPNRKLINRPPLINLSDTQYEVLQQVVDDLDWEPEWQDSSKKWDVRWQDGAVSVEMLAKMGWHQKINHFPGMYTLSRKNNLAKNLLRMQAAFPMHYNFMPKTFLLPADSSKLRNYHIQSKRKGNAPLTFIVKPQASCQGRGIYLTQNLNEIEMQGRGVVQKYVRNPLLYKGLKFDLRVYALLAGCDPLRIYIYNEGLVRFATQKYQLPQEDNLQDLCMHLTNYAINKDNPKYVFNDSIDNLSHGHKKSMAEFFQTLKALGMPAHDYWAEIKDIIVKTLISGQPHLQHEYRMAQPHNFANNMCFQVLGFDFMIDGSNKVYLLQINHTPSFSTDTPLDDLIKSNVIRDTLVLMNISPRSRQEMQNFAKQQMQTRVFTGKSLRLNPEERQAIVDQFQSQRDDYEKVHLGSYEKIYPSRHEPKQNKYLELLEYSQAEYKQNSNGMRFMGGITPQPITKGRSISKYRVRKLPTHHTIEEERDDRSEIVNAVQANSSSIPKSRSRKLDLYTPDMLISPAQPSILKHTSSANIENSKQNPSKMNEISLHQPIFMREGPQLKTKIEGETMFSKKLRKTRVQ